LQVTCSHSIRPSAPSTNSAAIVLLFLGYPVISVLTRDTTSEKAGSNLGGINSTGQVAFVDGLPNLIDPETPTDALTRTGLDGKTKFQLVFSDEFNTDGRSFYPGDDPFWEAVDLWVSIRRVASILHCFRLCLTFLPLSSPLSFFVVFY